MASVIRSHNSIISSTLSPSWVQVFEKSLSTCDIDCPRQYAYASVGTSCGKSAFFYAFNVPAETLPILLIQKWQLGSATPSQSISFLLSLLPFLLSSPSSTASPHALIAPLSKDPNTLQYLTRINQRTPSLPLNLAVDLGGRHLWINCDAIYFSSTYRPVPCHSALCSLAVSDSCGDCFSSPRPGCHNNTCRVYPENPFTHYNGVGDLGLDALSFPSTDGFTPSSPVTDPSFLFSCAPALLTRGLAAGTVGIAGLGRTRMALPSQLAAKFSFRRRFALCLPSNPRVTGALFFGPGPYNFLPGIDGSQSLLYTPLLTNPISTAGTYTNGEPSYEYFVGVTAIKVGGTAVALNKTLLTIDKNTGYGGTKISTSVPYTTLETSIYKSLTDAFSAALANVTRVAAVAPFELCYDGKELGSTRVGPGVPAVELVLQNENVFWIIYGGNSMVEVKSGVFCFGFVDGGRTARTSIVIGGYQLEDNLVEFDLAYSRVGFSSTLLFRRTTCGNFNFTSSP
ncbi:basic 7S globulin-like [Phalaenopsis equestris]|uniref:basic 7S globulin-like n=1 Tax=Phalaenopsis equestris TaxID=78828 RepID=UPI0009E39EEC|nr:basic 7S globulin-like [Phalaenopsis equestris]